MFRKIKYLTIIKNFFQAEVCEVFTTNTFVEFGYKCLEIDKNKNADAENSTQCGVW